MNTRLFPYQIALISEVKIIEEEGLVEQAEQRGNYLLASLRKIQNLHEQIGDVRGKGLLVWIELVEDRTSKKTADALGVAVGNECLRRGLSMNIVRSTGGMLNFFHMAPPLSITEDEIDTAIEIIDDALTAVLASRPKRIILWRRLGGNPMELNDILYEKKDGIAIATFNRPAVLNAFRQATLREFMSILDDVQADYMIRVLIITGNGRAFSAGIDLKEMADSSNDVRSLKQEYDELQAIQDVTRRMVHLPKIIIAAVNGIAVGIGVETALASDIRLAADKATFAFTEVKRALFETNGVTYILPRLVGLGRAMQMLLTGEIVSAQDALNAGLVTRVVAQEQLMEYAIDMAHAIAANAPLSVRLVKQTMQKTYDLDLEAMMQLEVDGMMQCSRSEDLVEGFNAFLEKRPPVYKGK